MKIHSIGIFMDNIRGLGAHHQRHKWQQEKLQQHRAPEIKMHNQDGVLGDHPGYRGHHQRRLERLRHNRGKIRQRREVEGFHDRRTDTLATSTGLTTGLLDEGRYVKEGDVSILY